MPKDEDNEIKLGRKNLSSFAKLRQPFNFGLIVHAAN